MFGYTTTPLSIAEILSYHTNFFERGIGEIFLLIFCIAITFILLFYVFPAMYILWKEYKKQKEKVRKRNIIKQIAYQKEIEEEIEQSL